METQNKISSFKAEYGDILGLYFGIFFQAIFGGLWSVSMPYVLKGLGGSDSDVGIFMGLAFSGYFCSLILSFVYRKKTETINLKPIVLFGTAFLTVLTCVSVLVIILGQKGICKNPIPILFILVVFQGMNTCCLWPRFVGWVSACHEGKILNHRLGLYNLSWSTAGMIGPFIGGYLVQHSLRTPLLTGILVSAISTICVCFAKRPDTDAIGSNNQPVEIEHEEERIRVKFMLCSRLMLFITMVSVGIIRSQLPLLFKFNLGFKESDYGMAFTIMSIMTFVIFTITGRTNRWHYKFSLLGIAHLLIGVCLLLIIIGQSLWIQWMAMVVGGIIYAFFYASHLYYIISGAKQRATKMVIHEITNCTGIIIGSFVGGFLSDHLGRYSPYYFGLIVTAIGALGVLFILVKYRKT